MNASTDTVYYYIWGADSQAYGPVELPDLVQWIKDERVEAETWVYTDTQAAWSRAAAIPELKMFFQRQRNPSAAPATAGDDGEGDSLKPGALRRMKIFAEMDNDQIGTFFKHMETVRFGPCTHVYHKGDPGDAMYLVLDGEVRSALFVDGIESPIATLPPGSVFGEISLLDPGPHTADIVTNQETVLLKISQSSFERLIQEAPEAALPFLNGLSRAVAGRVRTLTRRYEDSVHMAQAGQVVQAI